MKILVMIPTYNEKENIKALISEILKIPKVEIVVVDDNSPDGTWKIVQGIKNKRVYLLLRTKNKGRGVAMIQGDIFRRKDGRSGGLRGDWQGNCSQAGGF